MTIESWDSKYLGGSIKRQIVNPDLTHERSKRNFDKQEFAEFVISKEVIEDMRIVEEEILLNPHQFKTDISWNKLNRVQQQTKWWSFIHAAYHNPRLNEAHFNKNSERRMLSFFWSYLLPGVNPIHLHQSMFTKSINFLASEEQRERWMSKVNNFEMIGCYAQTEMGHGSNVGGIETTATFDKATDEFVIHTPSIRAYKFWPGALGVHSTHAVVMAKMIIDKQNYGMQAFLVPIRSRETHLPYPGIEVGDIGSKMGYNIVDNGYLSFNQYRVPRLSLLSRFASVSREGEFELLGDPRALYQIMVATRTMLLFGSANVLSRACTMATRYAVCRR